jgi:tetratricopeptide (TPR) repeat protein
LTLKSKIFGNNHLEYAHTLNDLGLFYMSLGHFNFAEKYLMSAFEIYKKQGDSELDLSRIYLNLGVLYFDKGELEKSKVFFNQSLLQRKLLLDTNNPDFANVLNNLGLVYYEMDYIDSAEYLFLEASKIYQIVSDSLNEDLAMVLNNLGNLYSDIGRLDEAKTYYLGSMNIYKELFSSNSEEYCGSLQNLASLETELKKYKGAMEYYSEIFNSKSEDIENKFLFLQSNEKDMFWQHENYIFSIILFTFGRIQIGISVAIPPFL